MNADQVAAITITQAIQAIGVSAGILTAFAFLEGWPQAAWHTIRELLAGPLITPGDLEALAGAGPGDPQEARERLWLDEPCPPPTDRLCDCRQCRAEWQAREKGFR